MRPQRPVTHLAVAFAIITAVHIAVALGLAGWPVRGWLAGGATLRQLLTLYRPTESNVDVALLVTLQSILFIILVACTTPTPRGIAYDGVRRPFSKLRTGLVVTLCISELLLLAKALTIAIGADDALWPDPIQDPGKCGLVLLLSSTGAAALLMAVQFALATTIITRCVQDPTCKCSALVVQCVVHPCCVQTGGAAGCAGRAQGPIARGHQGCTCPGIFQWLLAAVVAVPERVP